jgi:hypothetical protein
VLRLDWARDRRYPGMERRRAQEISARKNGNRKPPRAGPYSGNRKQGRVEGNYKLWWRIYRPNRCTPAPQEACRGLEKLRELALDADF